jgi:predicted N-acetyltransferase YhbS
MDDLRIGYLCDAPDALPELARSFLLESPDYFRGQTADDVLQRMLTPTLQRDALPLALVAHVAECVAGTVAIRRDSISTHPHLSPWVAALHVRPSWRNRGIGSALVQVAEREAVRLGFAGLYAGSAHAAPLFERLGWVPLERLTYWSEPLVVLRRDLATDGNPLVSSASAPPILVCVRIAPRSDADREALHRGLAVLHREDGPLSVEGTIHDDAVVLGAPDFEHLERVIDALKRTYGVHGAVGRIQILDRVQPVVLADGRAWVPVVPWMDVLVRTPSRFAEAVAAVLPRELPTLATRDGSAGETTLAGCYPLEWIRSLRYAVGHAAHGQATVAMQFRWFRPVRRGHETGDGSAAPAVPVVPQGGPSLRARAAAAEPIEKEV